MDTTAIKVRTPWITSMVTNGFILRPWRHQKFVERTFGATSDTRVFERGTICGLLEFNGADRSLRIIAINNDQPHNGQFVRAVRHLEWVAKQTGLRLQVVQFWNDRLARWFGRRNLWLRSNSPELGEYAEYQPPTG